MWLSSDPSKHTTTKQVKNGCGQILGEKPACTMCVDFCKTFMKAAIETTAANGCKKCGIWPCSRNVFEEHDFLSSTVSSPNPIPPVPLSSTDRSPSSSAPPPVPACPARPGGPRSPPPVPPRPSPPLPPHSSRPCDDPDVPMHARSDTERPTPPRSGSGDGPYAHLDSVRRCLKIIHTNPDDRCFFRSVSISQKQHLQNTLRNRNNLPLDTILKMREKTLADKLRAQVTEYICSNFQS